MSKFHRKIGSQGGTQMERWQEKGQGLVEYALLLALVSIVVVAVLMLLGPTVGNIFSEIIDILNPL